MATATRVRRVRQRRADVKVRTIKSNIKRADISRQMQEEDAFLGLANQGTYLIPPYDPLFLEDCVERSNTLRQCIEAMVTNTASSGHEVTYVRKNIPIQEDDREELESFIEVANADESFAIVLGKVIRDYETLGYGFLEVIRDKKKRVSVLRHVKGRTMRLLPLDDDPTLVEYEIMRGRRTTVVKEYKRFRRFGQVVNGKLRYFKEYGDQRRLDMETGVYGSSTATTDATEILHFRQESPDAYGVPRWINQLPSILGSRESEECNLRYFEENTVPPLMLSVAGGRLTAQSYRELSDTLNKGAIGRDRQHRIMLVEAVPERESLDDKGTVSLKVDKLSDTRQSDGLFKEYDQSNQSKVRSSFRLPPVAIGMAQELSFAVANVSAFIAESQVYLPQRNRFDDILNRKLINSEVGLGLRTVKLISRVPSIANPETLIQSLTALNVMGALTPRVANEAANKILEIDLPEYPQPGKKGWEEWMDRPIALAMKSPASSTGEAPMTHAEQSVKDEDVKELEAEGDVRQKAPEHGEE